MTKIWIVGLALLLAAGVHAQETVTQASVDKTLIEKLQKPATGDADVVFLTRMIAQHEAAIERSKSILVESSDAKVRMLAGDLLKSLNTDFRSMKEWMTLHGPKVQTAQPAPMPIAMPAAEKMKAAVTMPVSASKVVTSSLPPVDVVTPTIAMVANVSPSEGLPALPEAGQEIENAAPKMEFLDGGI